MADPHCRSIVVAGSSHGSPAAITALRVTLTPCSPACVTQPPATSSICIGSTPARSMSALRTVPRRSVGWMPESLPFFLPMGLRTAPTLTASRMRPGYAPRSGPGELLGVAAHDGGLDRAEVQRRHVAEVDHQRARGCLG